MAAAQSVTGICNRALQLVGSAQQIMNLTDTSREGRACARAYDFCRRAELRAHPWNFAFKRAQLAADTTVPPFGPTFRFPWPTDCLRVVIPKCAAVDWQVEGRAIVSSDSSPLNIRYVADIEDPTIFDAMFCETLAYRIAMAIVQDMTQSSTLQSELGAAYKGSLIEARKVDALESLPETAPDSSWITARYVDSANLRANG